MRCRSRFIVGGLYDVVELLLGREIVSAPSLGQQGEEGTGAKADAVNLVSTTVTTHGEERRPS